MNNNIRQKLESALGGMRDGFAEQTGFFRDLQDGTLPIEAYVRLLRALTALSTLLPDRERLGRLQEDLFFFRYPLIGDRSEAVEETLRFVADMRSRVNEAAHTAEGYAFALEAFKEDIAGCIADYGKKWDLGAAGGFSYVTGSPLPVGGSETVDFFEGTVADVLRAATDIYEFLGRLCDMLFSAKSGEEEFSSFTLNPASGSYPACGDRDVLLAVLHASDRALAENPYYVRRYGRSAWFFSDSDGAWLATLSESGLGVMKKQIRWLAEILTSRGMPAFLLARHLLILREELQNVRPEQAEQWELLRQVSHWLDPCPEDVVVMRVAEEIPLLQRSAGFPEGFEAREAAEIITRALLDENRGLLEKGHPSQGFPGVVQSVVSWYVNPDRFPASWIASVDRLVENASELIESLLSGESGGGPQ